MAVMGVMEGPRRSRGSMAKPALPDGRTTPQRSSLSITGHAIIQGLASITKGCVWRAGISGRATACPCCMRTYFDCEKWPYYWTNLRNFDTTGDTG